MTLNMVLQKLDSYQHDLNQLSVCEILTPVVYYQSLP
jgi:hypothetical protein